MPRRSSRVRVAAWNVNGLRACAKRGFLDVLERERLDILGVQEVRATAEQLPPEVREPAKWHTAFVAARRAGYSGVGLYARRPPDAILDSLGSPRFDREGRVQIARFGRLVVANAYFPNGNGKARDNSRVPFKLAFYRRLFEVVQRQRRGGLRVLVMGDFNTAHTEIDLARPKDNRKTSGFLPEERAEFSRWVDAGWIDTFREFEAGGGHYSWWTQRGGARERNVGWRIDYVLASPNLRPFLRGAFIRREILGSDHCPVGVDLEADVFG
ncbi:MAG: exodeoxyribonuclease III [Myxococcales bacterium FL481]|nr:MAG: exodeoxyribonuclease III [Myxococcales bacterium FL481]